MAKRLQSQPALLSWLQAELKPQLRYLSCIGAAQGVCVALYFSLLAWCVHQILVAGAALSDNLQVFALLLLVMVLRAGLTRYFNHLTHMAGERSQRLVRERLLAHWGQPQNAASSPAQADLLLQPLLHIHGYFARFQPQLRMAVWVPVILLLWVFYLDWVAALFLLFAAPIIPLFMALVGMGAERLNREHLDTTQKLSGLFIDRVRALTNLQLFAATARAERDIAAASQAMREANMKTLRVAFLSSAVLEFFAAVAIAAVAIYVGFSLLGYYQVGPAADMTLFSGLAILLLAPEFFQPMRTLATHYHDRAAALAATQYIEDVLRVPDSAPSHALVEPPKTGHDRLTLHNASFAYPQGAALWQDLNCQVKPGELLLITGPSGVGKSTLLKVITGQLAPTVGHCYVPQGDGIPYQSQTPFFVPGSIADNLRLMVPQADDQRLHQALQQVALDKALDTPVYEGGEGLSGGEQRRLSLARVWLAMAQDPHAYPLLVFDEPTASLDEDSCRRVQAVIQTLLAHPCIVVVASHDPAWLALADQRIDLTAERAAEDAVDA